MCHKTRDEQHKWENCKCSVCGKRRNKQHVWVETEDCSECGGTGKVANPQYDPSDWGYDHNGSYSEPEFLTCGVCNGTGGREYAFVCKICRQLKRRK
jgi:rRNA maturation protein Nop10